MTHSTTLEHPPTETLNVSTYRFVRLDCLSELRDQLKRLADSLALKGTILLSPEGINLFLAGTPGKVRVFFERLRLDPRFSDIAPKESFSAEQPFRRMLVRIKKEIIAFGVADIVPERHTAPKLAATELKRWLDEGRAVRLLDVRNDYEIELGTFRGAESLNIHHFREFPQAISHLPAEARHQPLVMFCTGGIRCEKAGPLMEQAGFTQVYQLDGGILKYFEQVGGDHWQGSCFVFDGRVALDPQLRPTGDRLCFKCQAVLRPDDWNSPRYKLGESCPYCYQPPEVVRATRMAARQQRISQVAQRQPGSQPYDNLRRIHVPGRLSGLRMIDFLSQYQPAIAVDSWQRWLEAGQITAAGRPVGADQIVREGQCFEQHQPDTCEPEINPSIQLLHEDDSLVVVHKPAPLPCHPSGRYNRNTLTWILEQAYPQQKLRLAHRLDAWTTGVVVLCRKAQASRWVQPQFAAGQVSKTYLAQVHGQPTWERMDCRAAISDQPCAAGARRIADDGRGLACLTHFSVRRRLPDGSSLIEASLATGRTHQIRLHLWHLGYPVVGDPLYRPAEHHSPMSAHEPAAASLRLHARSITLRHPEHHQPVTYESPWPDWAAV